MVKEYATSLKCSKGGVSMFLPPKSRRSKRAGSSTDPAQINPIILKAVKNAIIIQTQYPASSERQKKQKPWYMMWNVWS